MSNKDLLRLNLERATEIRDGKQDGVSSDGVPSSPSSLSKSGILKSPKDKTKSSARAQRTASVQFNLDSGKSSPTKADAETEVIVSSPIPQDLGENKKLRNFFGIDDYPASPRTSPKLSRSESSFTHPDSPGKNKKRAASTSTSLEATPRKGTKMAISSSEPDLTSSIASANSSVASTPRKGVSPRHSSSASYLMYPGDSPSRRATVHITATPSPLATMPFLNQNGSVEGYILTKTKKSGWKKIWIRTEGSLLLVHKERADSKPSKQFDLKNASIKYGEPQDNTLSIQISLGDGKMLLFSADSDSNVTVWCNLLNDVIQRNSAAKQRRKSQIPMELVELLTEEMNSNCAECSAEPADIVSVALGAFVCKDCGTLHRALDPNISTFVVPSSAIDWNPAAVKFMRDIGNKAHNEFWEKEIPSGITKPTPNSSLEEKKQWVLTKYVARSMTGGASTEDGNKRIRAVQLPERYADDNGMLTPQQKEYVNHYRSKSADFNIPVLLDSARRKKLRQKEFNISPASSPHTPTGSPTKNSSISQSGQGQASGLVGSGGGAFDSFLRSTDLLKEALLHMLQDTEFRRDLKSILLDDTKKE